MIAWYRNPEHRRGWSVETESELGLYLSRGDERLAVEVTEDFWGGERTIFYRLLGPENRIP